MAYLELHQARIWFTVYNFPGSRKRTTWFVADKRESINCKAFLYKGRATEHPDAMKQGVCPFHGIRIVGTLLTDQLSEALGVRQEMKAEGWYLYLSVCAVFSTVSAW